MKTDTVMRSNGVIDLLRAWINVGLPKSDLRALIHDLRELADLLEQKLSEAK